MPGHRRNKPVICVTLKPENIARLDEEAARLGQTRSGLLDWMLDILLDSRKNLVTTLDTLRNGDDPDISVPQNGGDAA